MASFRLGLGAEAEDLPVAAPFWASSLSVEGGGADGCRQMAESREAAAGCLHRRHAR